MKKWTQPETQFLIDNAMIMTDTELEAALNITHGQLSGKLFGLGITGRRNAIKDDEVTTIAALRDMGLSEAEISVELNVPRTRIKYIVSVKGLAKPRKIPFTQIPNEMWCKIEGYDRYSVSDMGRVRNDETMTMLQPFPNPHGYMRLFLYRDRTSKGHVVHRLVAEHFIPNPENKPEVNHKDLNKAHNHVGNLEWATSFENMHHAGTNLQSIRQWLESDQVHSICQDFVNGMNAVQIADKYDINYLTALGIHRAQKYKPISSQYFNAPSSGNAA